MSNALSELLPFVVAAVVALFAFGIKDKLIERLKRHDHDEEFELRGPRGEKISLSIKQDENFDYAVRSAVTKAKSAK
ncbi:MAG TPA: hypothetical protein VHQ22_00830 [Terriglobales bacterium]|jgi:hypothetical protein|nr:hypothetical protein [Terriglobales bacterium]